MVHLFSVPVLEPPPTPPPISRVHPPPPPAFLNISNLPRDKSEAFHGISRKRIVFPELVRYSSVVLSLPGNVTFDLQVPGARF